MFKGFISPFSLVAFAYFLPKALSVLPELQCLCKFLRGNLFHLHLFIGEIELTVQKGLILGKLLDITSIYFLNNPCQINDLRLTNLSIPL